MLLKKYIDSPWIYYGWDWFINAKLRGYKSGQIVTILKDVNVDEINIELLRYKSFTFSNYKDELLSYMETPSHLQRKEDVKKKEEAHKSTSKKNL